MKLHLPKMLRMAVLTCLAAVGASVPAAATEYTWSTAAMGDKGAYYGFAVPLDDTCLTVSPSVSHQVTSLYLDSLTLQTRESDNKTYGDAKIAVYEYTASGTTGTFLGLSESASFALDSDITFDFTEVLQLKVGSTYQFLFVAAGTEADLSTYEGYRTADLKWGINVTATQSSLGGSTGLGVYSANTLSSTQNRTFVGSLSTVGYDKTLEVLKQDFTQVTELPQGWTSGQWNGWNTPHFRFDADKGVTVNYAWKQNSLEKAVTLLPTNRYQISFTTYSETADKGCIFYMSSDDYAVAMGQSYNDYAYVSVGYLESGIIASEVEAAEGAQVVSFQPGSNRAVPTLFGDTAKSEASALNNAASFVYDVILDGTYLSVSVTDGTATWEEEFTIRENVTFDKIGFLFDSGVGMVGLQNISIQETTFIDISGGGIPDEGQTWLGGEGEWTDSTKWSGSESPAESGVVNLVMAVDSQIILGGDQSIGTLNINTNEQDTQTLNTTVLKEGSLTAEEISLQSGKLVVDATAGLQTNMLNGGEGAVLSGKVQIVPVRARIGKIGVYTGSYDDAVVEMKGGSQVLTPGAGLAVKGDSGTAILRYAASATMEQISTTGATVVLDRADGSTLNLNQESSMQGGALEINISETEIAAGTAVITAGKALKLDGTTIVINTGAPSDSTVLPGVTEVLAKTTIESDAELNVKFDSMAYSKYYSGVTSKDGELRLIRNTSFYGENLKPETKTGAAGIAMADGVLAALNPQAKNPDGTLAKVLNTLDDYVMAGASPKSADEVGAALAGAGTAVLGMAISGDVERQLKSIRNRTTSMGVDQTVVNPDLPYYNAWFNAEGDQQELTTSEKMGGYKLNTWGGTVGFDVDLCNTFTAGMALTAMMGDLDVTSEDSTTGDLNTYYVSAFARVASGAWSHTFIGTVGMADISLNRTVAGDKIEGDTDAMSFGLMYETGRVIALDEDGETCIQPVFNVAWRHSSMDSYKETGSDAALEVGEQTMNTVTFGLGARLQTVAGQTTYNRTCIFECRAMAKVDAGDRSSTSEVELAGLKASMDSQERGAVGLEAGAGLIIPVGNDSGAIFVDGSVDIRADYTNMNGSVGYRVNF